MAVETVKKRRMGWGEDTQKMVQLMLRHFNHHSSPNTNTNTGSSTANSPYPSSSSSTSSSSDVDSIEFDEDTSLPSGWEKCLDLNTGAVYYVNSEAGTLPMTPPWKKRSQLSSPQPQFDTRKHRLCYANGGRIPDLKLNLSMSKVFKRRIKDNNIERDYDTAEMRLVGCPRCFMYFMLSTNHPNCPTCKGSFLIEIHAFLNK